jgi:hypothetical protein
MATSNSGKHGLQQFAVPRALADVAGAVGAEFGRRTVSVKLISALVATSMLVAVSPAMAAPKKDTKGSSARQLQSQQTQEIPRWQARLGRDRRARYPVVARL